jgi:hypothetical protein
MKAEEIKELLTAYTEAGVSFKFIKKTGLKMEFETAGIEGQAAIDLVKKLIRSTDYGKVLYFSVSDF